MRKQLFVLTGLAALALCAGAVAEALDGPRSVRSLAAGFTAAPASVTTRTCNTTDGKTFSVTRGRYTGTSTGDADLAGAITLDARSVIDTTDGVGIVEGRLRIDVASGRNTVARFTGVYDHGRLAGLTAGYAHEPRTKLVAGFSATFGPGTGFADGRIGGSAGGSAVELGPAKCEPAKARVSEKSSATGTVSTLSQTAITVAGLTCALPPSLAAKVNGAFHVGDRAAIRCALLNGQNTLIRIARKR